jgi:hypothetical protein
MLSNSGMVFFLLRYFLFSGCDTICV